MFSQQSALEGIAKEVASFKSRGIVPNKIDFGHPLWIEIINKDIEEFDASINKLKLRDKLFLCTEGLLLFMSPCLMGIVALCYVSTIRNLSSQLNSLLLGRLIKLYLAVNADDTFQPITLKLVRSIAPFVVDEDLLKHWLTKEGTISSTIERANPVFLNALAVEGFLSVSVTGSMDEALASHRAVFDSYQNYSSQIALLKQKINLLSYGQASIFGYFKSKKTHEIYFKEPIIIERILIDNQADGSLESTQLNDAHVTFKI